MVMQITLNGKTENLAGPTTVYDLLNSHNIKIESVTVEVNETIIAKQKYGQTQINGQDRVEFVYFMGGGQDVADLIGKTPLVQLKKISSEECADIFAKVESINPGGSVKDRICKFIIEAAEQSGELKRGGTIIEPTSGNTGIGLAMLGALRGYKVILTMPETMSLERIYILKSFGAEVVLTPGIDGMQGAIKKAKELAKKEKAFMPQQFDNPANPEAHRKTTAVEIIDALGLQIDAFVAGVGTGGTITGVASVLKEKNPKIKIVAVEPATSAVLSGGQPGPHKIQGIGSGFIPAILNRSLIDQVVTVKDDEAFQMSRKIAQAEGLFVGISSGAAACGALQVARELGKGKKVVTIFPDTGERYFSMEQFFLA